MNIQIAFSALQPEKPDYIFRSEAVSSLRRLQDAGFALFVSDPDFMRDQTVLLEEERIQIHVVGSQNTDYSVTLQDDLLKVLDLQKNFLFDAENWPSLAHKIIFPDRKSNLKRTTKETDISVELNLDGTGKSEIDTGIGFFDHMLDQIAKHSLIDLDIHCKGDLKVDEHHTIEDVAILLGQTITKALGEKKGIERYGFVLPMDESRATIALDLSGRPFLIFEGTFKREYVGEFPTEMTEHFFYSLAMNLNATLHISVLGDNDHHKIEACFKGFARTLRQCIRRDEHDPNRIPSSKGVI